MPNASAPSTVIYSTRRADSTEDQLVVRAAAKVVAAVEVNRRDGLIEIEDPHIWTPESVRADRLDFRPSTC